MPVGYGNKRIVTDGLVVCLDATNKKSYPGTGDVITNLASNGASATLSEMVYTVSGSMSYFNSDTTGSMAQFSPGYTVPTANGFNITMLVRPLPGPSAGWNYMFDQGGGGSHRYEMGMYTTARGILFKDNAVPASSLYALASNTSGWQFVSFGARTDGYSYAWSTVNKSISLSASPGWLGGTDINFNHFFRQYYGSGSTYRCDWNYLLIYNRELTENEILQNYNSARGRFSL